MVLSRLVAIPFALSALFAIGCVALDEDDAALEEIEAVTGATLKTWPTPVRPGSDISKLLLVTDDGGYLEGTITRCTAVGGGGSECIKTLCANFKVGEDHHCQATCGYSCNGTPDECVEVGC